MSKAKRTLALLAALSLLLSLSACGGRAAESRGGRDADSRSQSSQSAEPSAPPPSSEPETPEPQPEPEPGPITEEGSSVPKIELTVGEAAFSATLYDNAAARALLELLPMTLEMSELNGNEKYHYLSSGLPTDPGRPAGIHTGDIMLYGDSCLVLFYKSFSTTYSYTALGRLDDPEGLAEAVGSGDVTVIFGRG